MTPGTRGLREEKVHIVNTHRNAQKALEPERLQLNQHGKEHLFQE